MQNGLQIAQVQSFSFGEMRRVRLHSSKESAMSAAGVVEYPESVKAALSQIYRGYNASFAPLVQRSRQDESDYQLAMDDEGVPENCFVQIDMCGLSNLCSLHGMSVQGVIPVVQPQIFEIENSLAMYQLMREVCPQGTFKANFDEGLELIRQRHRKPIALLAVTDEKYAAMAAEEFGVLDGGIVPDETVKTLSGFDKLFGPRQFLEHLAAKGKCEYALYVRSSDPIDKLRKPNIAVEHPLLARNHVRKEIRRCSLTFNVDDPSGDRRIGLNDTKAYMPAIKMGLIIHSLEDLLSAGCVEALSRGASVGEAQSDMVFSDALASFLRARDFSEGEIASGRVQLRAKPLYASYGCYGHQRGFVYDRKFRNDLKADIKKRGPYVIQPELATPTVFTDSGEYTFIDRVFFRSVGGDISFMGGFRSYISTESVEARRGRIHGSVDTVWSAIV